MIRSGNNLVHFHHLFHDLMWGGRGRRRCVGALTSVVSGVVQVFHELLVELRLLLVAEVEEGEEEDRQEEG